MNCVFHGHKLLKNTFCGLMTPFVFCCRDGFRTRLETIVRGQASSNSDGMTNDNAIEPRNDWPQTNSVEDPMHETNGHLQPRIQETDVRQLPDQTGSLEINTTIGNLNLPETSDGRNRQGQTSEDSRGNQQQQPQFDESRNRNDAEIDSNWQQTPPVNDLAQQTAGIVNREVNPLPETEGVWRENGSREAVESWTEAPSDPPRIRRAFPVRRFSRFHPPDDDNVYSMELRELLSR